MRKRIFFIFIFVLTLALKVAAQEMPSVSVIPLNGKIGIHTLYEVKFTSPDTISQKARFSLTFPSEFDLSMVSLAGSKIMDGGFSVTVKDSILNISRNGEGKPAIPGSELDLLFSIVKNPDNADNDYFVLFRVLDFLGNTVLSTQSKAVEILN